MIIPAIDLIKEAEGDNSTGLGLWISSEVLAKYIMEHSELIDGKRVLEMGAGLGLVGIVAHFLGATRVLITDGDVDVLSRLRHNVRENIPNNDKGDLVSCPQLIWGRDLEQFLNTYDHQDVVLASDCLYMKQSVKPFFETIRKLLKPDGLFVYANRSASQAPLEYVLEMATKCNFEWTMVDPKEPIESIYLFRQKAKTETTTEETSS